MPSTDPSQLFPPNRTAFHDKPADFRERHSTQRRRTDRVIEEYDQLWRSLIENAPDIIMTLNRSGTILFINRTVPGLTVKDVIGTNAFGYILPAYHETFRQAIKRVFQSGMPETIELAGTGPNKTTAWYASRIGAIKQAGEVASTIVIATDITPRKLAETTLKRQQIEQEVLLDLIPAMVWFKDTSNNILKANRLAAASVGLKPSEMEGRSTYDLYPDEAEQYFQDDLSVIKSGKPKLGIIEFLQTKSGEKRWVQTDKVPYVDEQGQVIGVVVFAQDITEIKRLEKNILDISDTERQRIGQDLHDTVGQDLTAITFMCGVLEQKLSEKSSDGRADANRISELVQQATAKIRHITRGLYPVITPNNFLLLVKQLMKNTEDLFCISCRFVSDPSVVISDNAVANHLYRIIQEGVNNSVKHGHAKHITLDLQTAKKKICMTLADDGVGIPANRDSSKGMGLHIMNYRAHLIGGSLEVKRGASGGTVVACSLPLAQITRRLSLGTQSQSFVGR